MRDAWLLAGGLRNVRLETYAGTHWMDSAQIAAGLRWFAAPGKK